MFIFRSFSLCILATLMLACSTDFAGRDDWVKQRESASGDQLVSSAEISRVSAAERVQGTVSPALYAGVAPEPITYSGYVDSERYLPIDENPIQLVAEHPVSTFSVDVDTASYSNTRRMLEREGRLPPSDAVRSEEFINYFRYQYSAPDSAQEPFSVTTELAESPMAEDRVLLSIALQGYDVDTADRPPANLVFLVDVSGSMRSADKLPLVQRSLEMLVAQMGERDRIALVAYAGSAGLVLDSTPGNDKAAIYNAIQGLHAGGSTHGSAGIQLAYQVAEQHFIEQGINRILIASDGDMNVGITDLGALKELVERKRQRGISLTTLGFGSGNYNDGLMEQLADVGNGSAAYIDSLSEAKKVLLTELNSTLMTIANNVKIQVEFNPQHVAEYRLIGYENRLLDRDEFRDDRVDAGDIGAGHQVTALYELSLVGSSNRAIDDLRYTRASPDASGELGFSDELAHVRLRYTLPEQNDSVEMTQVVKLPDQIPSLTQASENLVLAATVAQFAELLRGGEGNPPQLPQQLVDRLNRLEETDSYGYRAELIDLIQLADTFLDLPERAPSYSLY